MGLTDTNATVPYLIRDRDAKYPALFDEILNDVGIRVVLPGIRTPRMNAIMERWVQTCRHELLDRTLLWNEHHLRHALRQFELHHNLHRPHQAMHQAAPLHAVPEPLAPAQVSHLDVRRRDRLGGVLHEYQTAA
jgi:transposase InsO family protein